jgi:threonine/homoserine/homoserine lactone efflux protein
MRAVLALVAFCFVGTVSPGPNNAILWASGTRFGLARTMPHVLGTVVGMAALVVAVALGLGSLVDALPGADLTLRIGGSAYMLYLAYLVAGAGVAGRAEISRPLSIPQAAVFQWLNPKAWIFALAVVATFTTSTSATGSVGAVALVGVVAVIVLSSSSMWAAGGAGLGALIERDRARRAASIALAVLLIASVALLWV